MYKIVSYDYENNKTVDEVSDETELKDLVDLYLNDLEISSLKTFTVSRVKEGLSQKPFWEKKE